MEFDQPGFTEAQRRDVKQKTGYDLHEVQAAIESVTRELFRAATLHPGRQASLHEGYAVLLEEVDEVWDLVKMKAQDRPAGAVRKELIQVAAMAIRAILEVKGV